MVPKSMRVIATGLSLIATGPEIYSVLVNVVENQEISLPCSQKQTLKGKQVFFLLLLTIMTENQEQERVEILFHSAINNPKWPCIAVNSLSTDFSISLILIIFKHHNAYVHHARQLTTVPLLWHRGQHYI